MDLQDLKTGWNTINYLPKNDLELEKMTVLKNHPVLKKIKTKLIIEIVAITILLMVYYSGFDGDKKPVSANMLLIIAAFAYIINGLINFLAIQKPIHGENLKKSINSYYKRIKIISGISLGISIFYTCCLLLFFGSTIDYTGEKKWIIIFAVILLIQVFLWSTRIWKSWLEKLKIQIGNFN